LTTFPIVSTVRLRPFLDYGFGNGRNRTVDHLTEEISLIDWYFKSFADFVEVRIGNKLGNWRVRDVCCHFSLPSRKQIGARYCFEIKSHRDNFAFRPSG